MGKKPNPAAVGAFVLGAIALVVVGVVAFGSGQYFKKTNQWVLYFPGSVNGLNVGAPVKFRGVEFGRVTNIELVFTPNNPDHQVNIPVYVETDPSKITFEGTTLRMGDTKTAQALVERGLRAQLQPSSLVTGLLFVQIDFFPDTPVRYVLPQPSLPPEIPTVPTTLEEASSVVKEIIGELRNIQLGPMIEQVSAAFNGLDQLINSPEMKKAVERLPEVAHNLNSALSSANGLLARLDGHVGPFSRRLDTTLVRTQQTLGAVEKAAGAANTIIEPGSPLDHDLRSALVEIANAARSVQQLADYLERNPSALLYGKPAPEGNEQ